MIATFKLSPTRFFEMRVIKAIILLAFLVVKGSCCPGWKPSNGCKTGSLKRYFPMLCRHYKIYFKGPSMPNFAWEHSDESGDSRMIALKVDFNDNGPGDVAKLKKNTNIYLSEDAEIERNECILTGYLKNDAKVPVTVGGCPGSNEFHVHNTFLDKGLNQT